MSNDPLVPVSVPKSAGHKEAVDPFNISASAPTVARGASEWLDEPGAQSAIEDTNAGEPADGDFGYPQDNVHS